MNNKTHITTDSAFKAGICMEKKKLILREQNDLK